MLNILTRELCDWCKGMFYIKLDEPIIGTMKEIERNLPDLIETELEEIGWKDGFCPDCSRELRNRVKHDR